MLSIAAVNTHIDWLSTCVETSGPISVLCIGYSEPPITGIYGDLSVIV